MIAKARRSSRRKEQEPLEVNVTLRFNYGDEPQDGITVLDDQRIPMVGSVFEHRNRILRAFARFLVKTGLSQPKVVREIFPALHLLKRK